MNKWLDTFKKEVERTKSGIYNDIEAKSAVTWNKTHIMLENTGPEILIDSLNVETVMNALTECRRDKTCHLTDVQYNNVKKCINTDENFMDGIDMIFIHDTFKGLVSVKKKVSMDKKVASVHV